MEKKKELFRAFNHYLRVFDLSQSAEWQYFCIRKRRQKSFQQVIKKSSNRKDRIAARLFYGGIVAVIIAIDILAIILTK